MATNPQAQQAPLYNVEENKSNLGTILGLGGGSLLTLALLKEWGTSEATYLARMAEQGKGVKPRIHPAAMLGAGGILGVLGKLAYDKYKEYKNNSEVY